MNNNDNDFDNDDSNNNNNDDWDQLINLEAQSFESGKTEALLECNNNDDDDDIDDFYDQGYNGGYIHGLTLGIEVSFYLKSLNKLLQMDMKLSDRTIRRCNLLLETLNNCPNINDKSFDFDKFIDECRTLFKLISSETGIAKFRPTEKRNIIEARNW